MQTLSSAPDPAVSESVSKLQANKGSEIIGKRR